MSRGKLQGGERGRWPESSSFIIQKELDPVGSPCYCPGSTLKQDLTFGYIFKKKTPLQPVSL